MNIGMRPARQPPSLIAQSIAILRAKGGSWWQPDPAYTATGSDGTGAAGDNSDAGYGVDLCASYGPELRSGKFNNSDGATFTDNGDGSTTVTTNGSQTYAYAGWFAEVVQGEVYEVATNANVSSRWIYYLHTPGQPDYVNVGSTPTRVDPGEVRNVVLVPTGQGTRTRLLAIRQVGPEFGAGSFTAQPASIREIIGRPLFQPTTGFKPKLRRVPKRLGAELLYNGGFTDGTVGWTTNGGTSAVASGEVELTSGGSGFAAINQVAATKAGGTYLVTGQVRCGTVGSAVLRARNAAFTTTLGSATVTSTSTQAVSFTFTAEGTQSPIQLINNSATAALTSYADNISIREVLEWGWAWVFDGVDDILSTPSLPAGTDETMMVCATSLTSAGIARAPIGKRNLNGGLFIRRESGGALNANAMTGSGFGTMVLESPHTNFVPFVATAAAKTGASRGRLNGTQRATTTGAYAGWAGPLGIGAERGTDSGTQWNGYVFAAAYCPTALSDAEMLIIERAQAQLGGITI